MPGALVAIVVKRSARPSKTGLLVAEQAHEHKSLVLRFASDDAHMQDRLDKELAAVSRDGWELVAFTTQHLDGGHEPSILHTFALRRIRMAGPRGSD
jgi:hypothetical protein